MTLQEIEALKAERDALAAHNSELVSVCKLAIDMFVANDCNVPNTIETLQDAIDATPQQCLRDVQSEAGVKGLRRGVALASGGDISLDSILVKIWSDGYAESVRQGTA